MVVKKEKRKKEMNEVIPTSSFVGHKLIIAERNNQRYVAMKPLVQALGLDWRAQQRLINGDPCLKEGKVYIKLPGADGKQYKMFALSVDKLCGWLCLVPVRRYKPELQEKLNRYREKCFEVLHEHFHGPKPMEIPLPEIDDDDEVYLEKMARWAAAAKAGMIPRKQLEEDNQVSPRIMLN